MGVMAGTLDLVQASSRHLRPQRSPVLRSPAPGRLDGLSFPMQFRGTPIQVTLTGDRLTLAVHPEGVSPSRPGRGLQGDVRELCPGEQTVFELGRDPAAAAPAVRD